MRKQFSKSNVEMMIQIEKKLS